MSGILNRELAPDLDTARRAIELLVRTGDVFEIRALIRDRNDRDWTEFGYFDSAAAAVKVLPAIAPQATGIYLTLNPVEPALHARAMNRMRRAGRESTTGDKHILKRTRLLLDMDATPVAGVSSTEAEHANAIERARIIKAALKREGRPDPLEGDSGNGAHLLYAIDLPTEDEKLVERVLKGANVRWGGGGVKVDTANHNPSRITKLFGTPARKGDSTEDRPHRRSRIMWAPPTLEVVPLELLEHLASLAPSSSKARHEPPPTTSMRRTSQPRRDRSTTKPADSGADFLRGFLAKHGIETRDERATEIHGEAAAMWVLAACPFNSDHAHGEAHVHALDSGRLGFACKHDSCNAYGWREFRARFEPDAYPRSNARRADTESSGDPAPRDQEYRFTELGNSQRLADANKERLRYVHAWNAWLTWDGLRWRRNSSGAEQEAAKLVVEDLFAEAEGAKNRADKLGAEFAELIALADSKGKGNKDEERSAREQARVSPTSSAARARDTPPSARSRGP